MPNDQFERIMRFAQRTGDRLIVTDPAGKEPVVILSLDEYEALVEGALGPGEFSTMLGNKETYEDDEYGEAPTLEIVERFAEETPSTPTPQPPLHHEERAAEERTVVTPPPTVPEEKKIPQKQENSSEEQFYLEPL